MNAARAFESRRRCLGGLSLLAVAPFVRPALADARVHRATRALMGTQVDIVVDSPASATAQIGIEAAFEEMARLEKMMSRFRADSHVAALQMAAGRMPLSTPKELLTVLAMAQDVSKLSAGAFDVTVGAYSKWNFGASHRLPSETQLRLERKFVDYRDVSIDSSRQQVHLRRPGIKLDLGGIAKLPILRAGLRTLQAHGLRNTMLNGGGDVLVSGQLQGRDWRIGLRDPRAPERLIGTVALREGFVAASGDYERCFILAGRRYHHILDPRTGWPTTGPHGVALIACDLEAVNGLGAAIMVAGAAQGKGMLAMLPEVDALIVDADQRPWLSAGMARRLQSV